MTLYGVKSVKQIRSAIVVCFAIAVIGLIAIAFGLGGCAVRHLPGGGTQPATKFEQILAWNAALAQANDGFADNVIGLQKTGFLGIPETRAILLKQAAIASADKRITDRIGAAATCAQQQVGANPTTAALDAAAVTCAQISGPAIATDINLIVSSVGDLNTTGILAVKDDVKRQALAELLASVQALLAQISGSLTSQGVIK